MKILYHHRTRATDAQGIHIAEIVRAFEKLGHTVEIAALVKSKTPKAEDVTTAAKQSLPLFSEMVQLGYNVVGLPMLLRRLWRFRADFLYERYSLFNFAGVMAAKLTGRPIVLEVNSPLALEQHRDGMIKLLGLARWSERSICNLASKVIVVSTPLKKIMEANGVRPGKLIVVPNGVDLAGSKTDVASHDASETRELRRQLALDDKSVVAFAGWFKRWHGLELLLEAFCDARLKQSNTVLLLIGDGPAMPDLREYVKHHAMENRVVFSGSLPHSQVARYLALAEIAVQPAANEYCCPMKILEYMVLGKAIVAPSQENILEVLKDGEAEFFEPGSVNSLTSALVRMIQDSKLRDACGKRARHAVEDRGYLWTRNAQTAIDWALDAARSGVLRPRKRLAEQDARMPKTKD